MAASKRAEIEAVIATLGAIQDRVGDDARTAIARAVELLGELDGELGRLAEQVRWLAGAPYRKKSEQAPPGQLAFELLKLLSSRLGNEGEGEGDGDEDKSGRDGDGDTSATSTAGAGGDPAPKTRPPRQRRGRELPVKVEDCKLEPDDPARQCSCCGESQAEIGFDSQRRFVYEPAKVYILEERRYKYACHCEETIATADPKLPAKPIPGSMASASLLAHLIVAKIIDGLPIERIAKRLRRHGADLATATLYDWFGRVGVMLTFLHRLQLERLRSCELISLDDTPLRARNRGHPNNIQTGRQWIYLGDVDQAVYAEFSPDWKGTHPRTVLDGFAGDVQSDGYAGINPLFERVNGPRQRVGCNDHGRRKFVQALERGDRRAQPVVDLYRALYAVERTARERQLDAVGRTALRQAESVPLWAQLEALIGSLTPRVEPKSPLGKAITYWHRQQPTLRAFLDDGRLPISNAHVERLIRLVAVLRKNSLFVGSLDAGKRYAILLSLMLECLLVGANPYDYLVDIIDKVADDWPAARAAELLPRAWLAARQAQAAEQQRPGEASQPPVATPAA